MSNTDFFTKYASRLLVLNGVDMATNNHDAGARATWSGRLPEGFPSFGALVAAARAPEHLRVRQRRRLPTPPRASSR